jgi:hypothetical protein
LLGFADLGGFVAGTGVAASEAVCHSSVAGFVALGLVLLTPADVVEAREVAVALAGVDALVPDLGGALLDELPSLVTPRQSERIRGTVDVCIGGSAVGFVSIKSNAGRAS